MGMHSTRNPHGGADESTVVGSVDPAGTGDAYVIADISTDDAWLSMGAEAAPSLTAWR